MTLRIGMIGAGLIGRKHIAKIAEHPDFVLAGIADVNRDAVAAANPDVPVFGDSEEMLDTVRPDAVIIASPNQLHAANGISCARRGLPFIIEKPVTDTVESAALLAGEVRKAGVATLVGHHRRHHLQVQKARELIRGGVIGDVVGISGVWATRKPEPYFEAAAWRSQKGGGVILINLIHEIDFMRFTAGEIVAVSAVTSNRQRGFAVEDTAACLIEFGSGAIGSFLLSDSGVSPWTMEQCLGEAPEFPYTGQNDYRFIGSKGSLEFPEMRHWLQENDARNWNVPMMAKSHYAGRVDPYTAQLSHFRDVVRGTIASVQSVEDGARTLIAAAAVSEAATAGQRIDIRARYAVLE